MSAGEFSLHAELPPSSDPTSSTFSGPWYRELNRYHWFVFVVAALGWLFDTMDQQLFTLARPLAMNDLIQLEPAEPPQAKDGESADETDVDDLSNIQLAYESIETARLIAER